VPPRTTLQHYTMFPGRSSSSATLFPTRALFTGGFVWIVPTHQWSSATRPSQWAPALFPAPHGVCAAHWQHRGKAPRCPQPSLANCGGAELPVPLRRPSGWLPGTRELSRWTIPHTSRSPSVIPGQRPGHSTTPVCHSANVWVPVGLSALRPREKYRAGNDSRL
jgi:hypothetical protein